MNMRDVVRRSAPLLVGLGALASAATARPAALDREATALEHQSMPVTVANRTVVVLRGPIAGYSAEERATGTMQRVEEALRRPPAARTTSRGRRRRSSARPRCRTGTSSTA